MSKNILLINPWIYDFAAYDFWMKPLGLLYLGGLLRSQGHRVSYMDCLNPYSPQMIQRKGKSPKRHPYGHGGFFRTIIEKPACLHFLPRSYCRYGIDPDIFRQMLNHFEEVDLVLVTSMMTYWYPGVFEAIKIVKENLPGVPVALGGKYASLCYDHAAAFSGADYVISGPGEKPVLNLLRDLFHEDAARIYDETNLDSLPYPAFDLQEQIDQIALLTSQGCPYRCSYCSSPLFYKKFLRRNPLLVADEIEFWQKNFGVTDFSFYDDALLVDAENHLVPMLSEVKKRILSCRFHCPNGLHLRSMDANLSRILYDSGFQTIRFGFETANFQQQRETGGKVRNEDLRQAVRHLKNAGYATEDIGIYLLCGIPGQKAADVIDSIEFVQECGAKPVLAEYSPIPGTKMWNDAVATSPFDIQHEPLYHNNSLLCCRNDDFSYEIYSSLKAKLKMKKKVREPSL
ncbi:MAG: cobalamin-dependent protein [Syntrophaceae bacterium]|nr:cobalamin-dependent protein [Syntrophaceae bacterium]HOC60846.1 cobalamin-dependent protein [Smithellaceae bacterium]HQM44430.1 cobalamin-dependent protein [Smithellaceae bacterium]